MTTQTSHAWQFFRAGGFDQVQISTPEDLAKLNQLDQKLWAALACPTGTLEIDQRMLAYIDTNNDGRIRATEIISAVDWTLARLSDPSVLFSKAPLPLSALSNSDEGQTLAETAKRLLKVLGRADSDSISIDDTQDPSVLFPSNEFNGDGLIPANLTDDESLKAVIADIITVVGSEVDRSGEQAISEAAIKTFFDQARAVATWQASSNDEQLHPFGDDTAVAIDSIIALKEKIEDYFTRVELASFDPRATNIMNGEESELVRLANLSLANTDALKSLPLAGIHHGDQLPLSKGINPAYTGAVATLVEKVIKPIFGENKQSITRDDWNQLLAKTTAYFTWQAAKPSVNFLNHFNPSRATELIESDIESRLLDLVAQDKSVAVAANGLVDLDKLIRFKTSLIQLLRNFVSFYDFYSRKEKAIFQAGTLYIDGKSCELVVEVDNIANHSAIAAKSESYLIYCTCTRRGEPVRGKETISIVAAITAGDEGDIAIGRNGIFYDREGNDWDASVVKVVQNAISVSEAFWSPYRRVASMVSEQIQKFAQTRDADMVKSTTTKLNETTTAPKEATPAEKSFDIAKFAGIFAAIGLAVGALGTALAAVLTGLMSLAWWQFPLVILGVIIAISGPSMLLAWFKLRRRSLGPILDGTGWAVNTQAKISIPFGGVLTELAQLPKGSHLSLRDPYEQDRPVWPYILIGIILIGGFVAHYFGLLTAFSA